MLHLSLALAASPPGECLSMGANSQDCVAQGSYVCAGGPWPGHPPSAATGQGRFGYCYRPPAAHPAGVAGSFDAVSLGLDKTAVVTGWAVDWSRDGGHAAVQVQLLLDGRVLWQGAANSSRPNLVKVHAAPDPLHGLVGEVPASVILGSGLLRGNHTLTLRAVGAGAPPTPFGRPHCVSGGRVLVECGGAPEPEPWYCCRTPPNDAPLQPTPPRIARRYPHPPSTRPAKGEASVVFVLTDDEDVLLGSLHAMNNTKSLLIEGGASFTAASVTTPICCPSRISILSGRWAHNTGAVATEPSGWCGIGTYWKAPMQNHSLPTYIRAAGITTGLFGKELNVNDDTYVSPGWDTFFALGGSDEGHFYNNWFNDGGRRFQAPPGAYMTDLIRERALAFVKGEIAAQRQFFAYVAPHAPHTRATPSPGTEGYFWGQKAPRKPSYNVHMPDHHWVVRQQPEMTDLCINASDELYRNRLRALLGVDELVGAIADVLLDADRLKSTYFVYSSDHGFHLGEMRMPYFKGQPYDTDLRVPMMVRGPGIAPGTTIASPALNVDIAPTIAALLHTAPPAASRTEGRSLAPLLFGGEAAAAAAASWRKAFIFEFWAGGKVGAPAPRGPYCSHVMMAVNNTYSGIRTVEGLKYVDFRPHEDIVEAFNLTADPFEMINLANDPGSQAWVAHLDAKLQQYRNCTGTECWITDM